MSNELEVKQESAVMVTPESMIQYAMSNGATMDQLEKLMDLKERYDASEAKKAFVEAMSSFRSKCVSIAKTRKGHNCKYAGLAETVEQISPTLVECGLSHRWETKQENKVITVTCYLTHEQGHSEISTMSSDPDNSGQKNSIQAIGSAISYLQRYTLFSVCGLASREMDDDGNTAGVQLISEGQINGLHALITDNDLTERAMKWLKKKGINELSEIRAVDYDNIYTTIKGQAK